MPDLGQVKAHLDRRIRKWSGEKRPGELPGRMADVCCLPDYAELRLCGPRAELFPVVFLALGFFAEVALVVFLAAGFFAELDPAVFRAEGLLAPFDPLAFFAVGLLVDLAPVAFFCAGLFPEEVVPVAFFAAGFLAELALVVFFAVDFFAKLADLPFPDFLLVDDALFAEAFLPVAFRVEDLPPDLEPDAF
jgi:hypothetical protein